MNKEGKAGDRLGGGDEAGPKRGRNFMIDGKRPQGHESSDKKYA